MIKRTTKNVRVRVHWVAAAFVFLVLLAVPLLAFFRPEAPSKFSQRTLTFKERAAYQRAIEDVYWRHRIWPKENAGPKPSLDAVMSQAQLERKVAEYLRRSQALEDYWQRPITAEQLQAEMNRMAKNTKQPEVLHELFEALGSDPFVIAECLARSVLVERTLATVASVKEARIAKPETQVPVTMVRVGANYRLPVIASPSGACTDDTWTATSTDSAPDARELQTAVWTGSEMIVWGGWIGSPLNTGGRYNPSTDSWAATSTTNAPAARASHTAVWTGSEMIVWGGATYVPNKLSTGGRYNPITDTWTTTSTTNAPQARHYHTAVWTGSEMIVWGGEDPNGFFNNGGRYNPNTDSWTAIDIANAPEARIHHTAVWTGSEMVVWGGIPVFGPWLNTGGRYNPSTDSWTTTNLTNVPDGREYHTTVWTGSEMIVWGGFNGAFPDGLNTGGRYNPVTDSWTATSIANAPDPRYWHSAVWIGSEMIIWGGYDSTINNDINNGGRYNPSTDTWTATDTTGAPQGRSNHTAVWTSSEMIVWGGSGCSGELNTGGRYCVGIPGPTPTPTATPTPPPGGCINDTWIPTGDVNAPDAREDHTAVWTGSEMIVWGGEVLQNGYHYFNTGAKYDPATDNWTTTSTTNAPTARSGQTAVWTGSEMIVWAGGDTTGLLNTGGRYNPMTDSWTPTNMTNAPIARIHHAAVWTGSEMIVWAGYGCGGNCNLYSGGRYNPSNDSWTPTSTLNVPSARWDHTAVWTGSEMIVWGGTDAIPNHTFLHTGGRYNPATDTWIPTSVMNVPLGRVGHTAVWTGSEMIVWGGIDETFNDTNTGGRYDPTTDTWTATTSLADAPSARDSHTAVWTGSEMIVWSGSMDSPCDNGNRNSGGRYEPITDSWTLTSTVNAPLARVYHTAVWTGSEMIVWGGHGYANNLSFNTGGRYCAQSSATPTPTPTATPTPTDTPTATPPRITPTPRARPTPAPRPTPR